MNENDIKEEAIPSPAPEQLELYREALLWLFSWTLAVILITGVPLVIMEFFGYAILTIFMVVILAGALGALFSAITRLYSLRQLPGVLLLVDKKRPKGGYLLVFCLVPPIVGMIGAAFFYLVMQSGVITSNIFADFCDGSNECKGLKCLFSYAPCTPADYAKAVVWGFVAGFSERFVPNILARLENSGSESKT